MSVTDDSNSKSARSYTDEQVIEDIQTLGERLGRTPKSSELKADKTLCSVDTVQNHFGSWNEGIVAAGYEPRSKGTRYYRDDVIEDIQLMVKAINELPPKWVFHKCPHVCSIQVVQRIFGDWETAVEEAGYGEKL